ncbi:MAG: TonB-dependent receptor [Rhizomicrobium sp.]
MTANIIIRQRMRRCSQTCLSIGLTVGMFASIVSLSANAQTMDYGSLEQLFGEPVTTSATGSPQRVTEVPVNMIIVTADEIRRSGARDIPSVLRHVAGVDVLQWSNDTSDVSIRGYNQAYAARTLVLIDGRQVYADYYGFIPWTTLPVELGEIRQIEIVKGPNSALFGFNAVGGVINIITYNPRYDDVNTASARTGAQGLVEASGVRTFRLGTKGGLRLSGGYGSDNEFTTPIPLAMTGPPRVGNRRASIDADAVIAVNDNVELGLEASHSHALSDEVSPNYIWQVSHYETNSIKGQLTADTNVGLLKLTAYTNWIGWRGTSLPALGVFVMHNQVTVIQAEDAFNLGNDHTMRMALEYRHNDANTAPTPGGTVSYDVASVSGMWNWRVSPVVSLTNAVRIDHLALGRSGSTPFGYPFTDSSWDRSITQFSFNSGAVWTMTQADNLRLIASRGVQLPSLVESGALLINMPPLQVTGNPALKPTAVTNYELAWNHNLSTFDAQLQLSAFHQRTDDLTSVGGSFIATPVSFYATPANIGSSDANGMELNIKGLLDGGWRWSVSYRAEFVEDKFLPFAANGADLVDYEHSTPKHVVKGSLGWTEDSWEADVFLGYQSKTAGLWFLGTGSMLVPVDAYTSLDGRVAYRITDWAMIAVSGQNLLQPSQRQTVGPAVERRLMATLSVND